MSSYPPFVALWQRDQAYRHQWFLNAEYLAYRFPLEFIVDYAQLMMRSGKSELPPPDFELGCINAEIQSARDGTDAEKLRYRLRNLRAELLATTATADLDTLQHYQMLVQDERATELTEDELAFHARRLLKLLQSFLAIKRSQDDPRFKYLKNQFMQTIVEFVELTSQSKNLDWNVSTILECYKLLTTFPEKEARECQAGLIRIFKFKDMWQFEKTSSSQNNLDDAYQMMLSCGATLLEKMHELNEKKVYMGDDKSQTFYIVASHALASLNFPRDELEKYNKNGRNIDYGAFETHRDFQMLLEKARAGKLTLQEIPVYFSKHSHEQVIKKTECDWLIEALSHTVEGWSEIIAYIRQMLNEHGEKYVEHLKYRSELSLVDATIFIRLMIRSGDASIRAIFSKLPLDDRKTLSNFLLLTGGLTNDISIALVSNLAVDDDNAENVIEFVGSVSTKFMDPMLYLDFNSQFEHWSQYFSFYNRVNVLQHNSAALQPLSEQQKQLMSGLPYPLIAGLIGQEHAVDTVTPEKFLLQYEKANGHADQLHKIELKDFLREHHLKLSSLQHILGNEVFNWLAKQLTTSVLPLNRLLESYHMLPTSFTSLIRAAYQLALAAKSPLFNDALILFCHLDRLNYLIVAKNKNFTVQGILDEIEVLFTQKNSSIEDLLQVLNTAVLDCYRQVLNVSADVILDLSKLSHNSGLIMHLITGRSRLSGSQYVEVFDKLLTEDLRVGGSFQRYITDCEQTDELGKALAQHNKGVLEELSLNGIDVALAVDYPTKVTFTTKTTDTVDLKPICDAIWEDLNNVEKYLALLTDAGQQKTVQMIQKSLKIIRTNITKGGDDPTVAKTHRFQQFSEYKPHFDKIEKAFKSFDIELPTALSEHSQHFMQRVQELETALTKQSDSKTSSKLQNREFSIEQWDKSNIDTFLLGNYLSCCLATDGARFEAIIQRRMDVGMKMHVIRDLSTQEVVCGNWLFFAKDQNGDVFVVANFFEIKTSYATKPQLRKRMMDELIQYTQNYAKEVKAKGFILRPLTYGLIPDFDTQFAKVTHTIEKVGGYFTPPSLQEDEENTKARYYLDAVDIKEFYDTAKPLSKTSRYDFFPPKMTEKVLAQSHAKQSKPGRY